MRCCQFQHFAPQLQRLLVYFLAYAVGFRSHAASTHQFIGFKAQAVKAPTNLITQV
jgi:hypothetical protein